MRKEGEGKKGKGKDHRKEREDRGDWRGEGRPKGSGGKKGYGTGRVPRIFHRHYRPLRVGETPAYITKRKIRAVLYFARFNLLVCIVARSREKSPRSRSSHFSLAAAPLARALAHGSTIGALSVHFFRHYCYGKNVLDHDARTVQSSKIVLSEQLHLRNI